MKTTVNRRDWLKRGVLTAAGVMAAPYLTYGAFPIATYILDAKGNIPTLHFLRSIYPMHLQARRTFGKTECQRKSLWAIAHGSSGHAKVRG